jgi:hypothetical protein
MVQKGKGYVVELLHSPEAVAEVEPSLAGGTYIVVHCAGALY